MKTIIVEKPSVAREIVRIAGAVKREGGYSEGGGCAMTWAFGHLVQFATPDGYGVRGFVRDNLPAIPNTFTLILHQVETEEGYKPDSGVVAQIRIAIRLFKESKQIIMATDTGYKGELTFRYPYHYTGCTTPFVRLWISSLTNKTIHEGLCNLEAGGKYGNLYLAAKARNELDQLVSINDTQALSTIAGYGMYSAGRVQTPTLVMVYVCHWEHRRPTSEVFWRLHIITDGCDEGAAKFSPFEKRREKKSAMELYDKAKSAGTATVMKAERKKKAEETPSLHGPTTLQKEANAKRGFAAEQMLEITQKFYERKLITYPRAGSCYVPENVSIEIPKLSAFIRALPERKGKVQLKAVPTHRSVDGGKTIDHHALFVMGEKPLLLFKENSIVYQMVAGRMTEAFSEEYVKDIVIIMAEYGEVEFTVKGSVIRQVGWCAVYSVRNKEEISIPDWQEGDTLTLKGCSITEGKTKPKSLRTEATLLSIMETTDKDIEDGALHQALKDCSTGTSATCVAIIKTLSKRGYMKRCKKLLVPTEEGLALYSVAKMMCIVDVAMTGGQEKELVRIERGELSADTFRGEIEAYAREITSELLLRDKLFSRRDLGCKRSKRGMGSIQFCDKAIRYDNAECGLLVSRLKANRAFSDDETKDLPTDGHVKLPKGFRGKQGEGFDAITTFDGDYNTTLVLPERKTSRKFSEREKQY